MRRHCHDGTGAILHKNKIREIDRNCLVGKRVAAIGSGKNPFLLTFLRPPRGLADIFYAFDETFDGILLRGALRKLQRQGMFYCE